MSETQTFWILGLVAFIVSSNLVMCAKGYIKGEATKWQLFATFWSTLLCAWAISIIYRLT